MKPILFNTEMVRAILDGRKTVTRRVVKQAQYEAVLSSSARIENPDIHDNRFIECLCTAPCKIGDILYVRETWQRTSNGMYIYRADINKRGSSAYYNEYGRTDGGWRPSIHMPKEIARIFLRVTEVRVERLQEITEEQARAEGARPFCLSVDSEDTPDSERTWHEVGPALDDFIRIWNDTFKHADRDKYDWEVDPWVWVIEFERCEKPEGGQEDG